MIPCSVDAVKLCVRFWHHVVNSNPDSLINKIYSSSVNNNSDWYRIQMKLLFDKVGFNHVWENQDSFNKNCLTYAIYKKLRNYFTRFLGGIHIKKYH
jgi:cytolysin (calcineurin-like family phosphatase)